MRSLTSRERLCRTLRRQEPDRVPMVEICFWPQTVQRWRTEGMPQDQDPNQYFGLDVIGMVGLDCSLRLPAATLEETEDCKVTRDADGAVHRHWKQNYAPPAEIDHTIKARADWQAHRHRLTPAADRIASSFAETVASVHAQGRFVALTPSEPVWWVLRTLGMEQALPAIALEPDWFEEMVTTHAAMVLELCRRAFDAPEKPDAIWFFSDLCYRNGMLFSPQSYRQLMLPLHRRFADLCHEHGVPLILHCDGYVGEFIPLLIEAGFDCIQPLEARAGNDVRKLKPVYGHRLAFFGNLDMDLFAAGDSDAVAHEVLTKLKAAMPGGGYIYHSDHSVPPTVSFATYSRAIALAREHGRYD